MEITEKLNAYCSGDKRAIDELMPIIYDELKRQARIFMNRERRKNHTLQATALVSEAYLRLIKTPANCESRAHFFEISAHVMHQILINHARDRNRQKRSGSYLHLSFEDALIIAGDEMNIDFMELESALKKLAELDARQARIVRFRFFIGLSIEETAEILNIGDSTVKRDWLAAKAFLSAELGGIKLD